jgi:hypothetical protein
MRGRPCEADIKVLFEASERLRGYPSVMPSVGVGEECRGSLGAGEGGSMRVLPAMTEIAPPCCCVCAVWEAARTER